MLSGVRPHQRLACSALLCAFVLAPACSRGRDAVHLGNGVLVIAIDALRADHVHCYGYDRETTPFIDGWAAQGTAFLNAFTPSPDMQGAHAAVLTGTEPTLSHRDLEPSDDPVARLAEWSIPQALPHLAREFLAAGYTTAAFVDHLGLSDVYGFGSGFEDFRCFAPDPRSTSSVGYEGVASKLLTWLRDRSSDEDWFAYVHVNDLERLWERGGSEEKWDTFFAPRAELSAVPPVAQAERSFFAIARPRWRGATRSLGEYEALYDGALRRLDTKFGLLFEELRKRGRLRNTTVAIVGTYGVGFGESGLFLDSGTLSDSDLHVPLIVRPAPVLHCKQGVRSNSLASLVDFAPTLLELAQLPRPAGMAGISLVPQMRGQPGAEREFAFASGGLQGGFAVMDANDCFERSFPASNGTPDLSRSWTGEGALAPLRKHLHDRRQRGDLGHLGSSLEDEALAARLEGAGHDWYTAVGRARELYAGRLRASDLGREELAHLRKLGLVGELP